VVASTLGRRTEGDLPKALLSVGSSVLSFCFGISFFVFASSVKDAAIAAKAGFTATSAPVSLALDEAAPPATEVVLPSVVGANSPASPLPPPRGSSKASGGIVAWRCSPSNCRSLQASVADVLVLQTASPMEAVVLLPPPSSVAPYSPGVARQYGAVAPPGCNSASRADAVVARYPFLCEGVPVVEVSRGYPLPPFDAL
jgi:hypothetical protein